MVDQAGVSGTGPLFGKNYAEGNLGYLRSTTAGDRLGGTLRLIFPVNNKIAFTLEGGVNETLLGPGNNGRVVAGVQFGNLMRPKEYLDRRPPDSGAGSARALRSADADGAQGQRCRRWRTRVRTRRFRVPQR